jgi:hypothetical protein
MMTTALFSKEQPAALQNEIIVIDDEDVLNGVPPFRSRSVPVTAKAEFTRGSMTSVVRRPDGRKVTGENCAGERRKKAGR